MRSRMRSYRTSSGKAQAAWIRTGKSLSVMQFIKQLSVFSRACGFQDQQKEWSARCPQKNLGATIE